MEAELTESRNSADVSLPGAIDLGNANYGQCEFARVLGQQGKEESRLSLKDPSAEKQEHIGRSRWSRIEIQCVELKGPVKCIPFK